MIKTLSTLAIVLGLAATGCSKKKDEAAKPAATEAAKPAEPSAAPAPAAGEAAAAPAAAEPAAAAAPAAATDFKSDDEYIAAGKVMMGKLTEVFKGAGTDCDKLAKDIETFAADPAVKATNAYEKAHPGVSKKFEEAAKAETDAFQKLAMDAIGACKDNQAVGAAMAKMAE